MDKPKKTLLFSVTKDDCDWDYFTAGGNGGQNQNRRHTGVRCTHRASGAVGEARDSRDQLRNRRSAFVRCVESDIFKAWHRKTVARMLGQEDIDRAEIERRVEKSLAAENLKVENYDPNDDTKVLELR